MSSLERKKEIRKQCWYNPELECAFVEVDRRWSQHRSEYFFLICWNEPALFVLSVCYMQFKEWVFFTWFYLLIPGAVWRTQSLDVRCKFLKYISKTLCTVPNSLHTKNCYHWGKSFPHLNQSEQCICGPWEVSKRYSSKWSLCKVICWQMFLKSGSCTEIDAKIFTSSSPSFCL